MIKSYIELSYNEDAGRRLLLVQIKKLGSQKKKMDAIISGKKNHKLNN